ncbi:MAG: RNase adapter RapZ [Lachnospiraceae bacterium]|nr:RNase adapter RapZ [Lachnospiraceae bacterium]
MKFVVVTGMSGGGKSTALKMLEDMGFYCIDNLPVPLIEKLMELIVTPNTELQKVALGLDVRAGLDFRQVEKSLDKLRGSGYIFEILFMDASPEALLKRYKETRRLHPLSNEANPRIENGIAREQEILSSIKKKADYVIDTTNVLTRNLREELERIFVRNEEYNSLMVNIISFGFKHGIPADADLVFDVRFLPNPFYIEELKMLTGNDGAVRDYVMGFPEAGTFLCKLEDLLEFLLPGYVQEGKHQLVIAIGCTGGQHRSVTLANMLYRHIRDKGQYGLSLSHRDIR